MHLVTCSECGKHYDYDKDDFCPKCGVYNPPGRQQPRKAAPARTGARPARSYAAQVRKDVSAVRSRADGERQEKKRLSFSQIILVLVVLYFISSFFLPLLSFLF